MKYNPKCLCWICKKERENRKQKKQKTIIHYIVLFLGFCYFCFAIYQENKRDELGLTKSDYVSLQELEKIEWK